MTPEMLDFAYRVYVSMSVEQRGKLLAQLVRLRLVHALKAHGPFPEGTTLAEAIEALDDDALTIPEPENNDLYGAIAHLAWIIGDGPAALVIPQTDMIH